MLFSVDHTMARRICVAKWIVSAVGIQVPALRIFRMLIGEGGVWTGKPPLRPGEIPGAKVVQLGLCIPFFAREAQPDTLVHGTIARYAKSRIATRHSQRFSKWQIVVSPYCVCIHISQNPCA